MKFFIPGADEDERESVNEQELTKGFANMNIKKLLPKEKIIKTHPNDKKILDALSIVLSNGFFNIGYSTFHEELHVKIITTIKGYNVGLEDIASSISKGLFEALAKKLKEGNGKKIEDL